MRRARALIVAASVVFAGAAHAQQAAPQTTQPKRLPIIVGNVGINLLVEVDGTVKSWGGPAADAGFYGDGLEDTPTRLTPAPIPGLHNIIGAAIGYDHALVLKSDGTLLGWGRNNGCSLALPDDHRRYAPVPFPAYATRSKSQPACTSPRPCSTTAPYSCGAKSTTH